MAYDDPSRELRDGIAELGKIAASLGAWEKQRWNDNRDYRDDVQEFKASFRRVDDRLIGISDAVTRTATDMELIAQQVRTSREDIIDLKKEVRDLDGRVESLEKGRSRERGAWAVIVFFGAAVGALGGAVIAIVAPGWIPHWFRGTGS